MLNSKQTDIIYLNASIYNSETTQEIEASYSEERTSPILNKCADYYVSLIRFEIPNTIPIFRFKDNTYKVCLVYNSTAYTTTLAWDQRNLLDPNDRRVWSFQHMLDMINSALETSFQALLSANPGAPQTEVPYMTFDGSTDLFSLWCQQSYDPAVSAPADEIEIWFSFELYQFFNGAFDVFYNGRGNADGRDYQFNIINTGNNVPTSPVNYYRFIGDIETLYAWYDFASIVFRSSSLPIEYEQQSALGNQGNPIQFPILTDFIPDVGKDRSNFIYNPTGEYRLIDMVGNNPLTKIDLEIFWIDRNGTTYKYLLEPNQFATVKLMFVRKTSMAA